MMWHASKSLRRISNAKSKRSKRNTTYFIVQHFQFKRRIYQVAP